MNPLSARQLRASDQDRSEAMLALSEYFAEGRLDQSEFDARTATAATVTYVHELDPLFADLPALRTALRPHDIAATTAASGRRPLLRFGGARITLPIVPVIVVALAIWAAFTFGHTFFIVVGLLWLGAVIGRRRAWRHRALSRDPAYWHRKYRADLRG